MTVTDRHGNVLRGHPREIHLVRLAVTVWRFTVLTDEGEEIDYSLASTLRLAWRMARAAFRTADRQDRQT